MTRPRGHRYAALALVLTALGCGDAATAPTARGETVLVSLAGLGSTDAGVVLELTGAADHIASADAALEVAWVSDATHVATVVIVGPLSDGGNVLVVRRPAGLAPLRVQVREVARADGAVSSTSPARAIVRAADGA
ncbi:MAG TPA: hypothetical protein VJ802_08175 [Gemmatimonadaceae bacterium]|nr:hypothetical protein [Gemmatimonadaceae bacterium]